MNKFFKIKKFHIFITLLLIISLIINSIYFIHFSKSNSNGVEHIHEYYIENNTGKDIDNLVIGYQDIEKRQTDKIYIKKFLNNSTQKGNINVSDLKPYNVYVKYTYEGMQRYLIYNLNNGENYLDKNFKIKLNIHTMDNEGYIYADYDNFYNKEVNSKNTTFHTIVN